MAAVSQALSQFRLSPYFDIKVKSKLHEAKNALLETIYSITTKRFSRETAVSALGDIAGLEEEVVAFRALASKASKVNKIFSRLEFLDLEFKGKLKKKEPDLIDRLNLEVKAHPSGRLCLSLCKATSYHVVDALKYLEAPLKVIASANSQAILRHNKVRLPGSTLVFFEKALNGVSPICLKQIGRGGFGSVMTATLEKSRFAFKQAVKTEEAIGFLEKEAAAYMLLKHSNITAIEAMDSEGIYLQLANGDLTGLFEKKHEKFSPNELKQYFQETAKAVSYIHSAGLSYKDLKLDNVLFASIPKGIKMLLCDLAFVTCSRDDRMGGGSEDYAAPELWNKRAPYCQKVDSWAFGVLIYQLVRVEHPFGFTGRASAAEIFEKVAKHAGVFSIPYPASFKSLAPSEKEFIKLAADCLHGVPDKRPSVKEILERLDAISC